MAPAPEAAEVRRLIARNNSKSAVELARQIPKRRGTPATEALLGSIRERFPASVHLLEPLRAGMPVSGARLEARAAIKREMLFFVEGQ